MTGCFAGSYKTSRRKIKCRACKMLCLYYRSNFVHEIKKDIVSKRLDLLAKRGKNAKIDPPLKDL